MNIKKLAPMLAAAAVLTLTGVAASVEADARERKGQATVQTKRGTYQGQSTVNREPGMRNREAVVTGPGGKQTTVKDTRTRDREAGTASHDRSRTFPDGTTRSIEADRVKTGEGTYTGTRTVTGRNGETRTQTGDFAVTKTDDGRTVTGDIQTQNRGQIDVVKDVSRTENGRTVNSTATFEDGTTASRASQSSCAKGEGCSSTTTLTDRQGRVTTIEQARAKTETGWEKSRDTTFSDGTTREVDVEGTKTAPGAATIERTVKTRAGETRTQTGDVSVTRTP